MVEQGSKKFTGNKQMLSSSRPCTINEAKHTRQAGRRLASPGPTTCLTMEGSQVCRTRLTYVCHLCVC